MDNSFDALIYRITCDVEQILRGYLDDLKDDLSSDDKDTRTEAVKVVCQIIDWLYPPSLGLSDEEKLRIAQEAVNDPTRTVAERRLAAQKVLRSTGRQRGRPRTDTSQHAIRALTLFYATGAPWRKIALDVKGCKHKRPNPERSCISCGDSIREAAGRLEKFLISIGFTPPTAAARIRR
jgi:hypothetical protein